MIMCGTEIRRVKVVGGSLREENGIMSGEKWQKE